MSKIIIPVLLTLLFTACVSHAPRLTSQQLEKLPNVSIYKEGKSIEKEYIIIKEVSAADCSGAPYGGRVWGNTEIAINTLKGKAIAMGADAVIDVSCSVIPLVNNCWAAQVCSGTAIKFP